MGFRTITSTTTYMTCFTNNILSLLIIIVANSRAVTSTFRIDFPSGLLKVVITCVASIRRGARHTMVRAPNTNISSVIKIMSPSTNTFMSIRINNFQVLNATPLTVGFVQSCNLTIWSWTFRNTKLLIDQVTAITIWTHKLLLQLETDICEL